MNSSPDPFTAASMLWRVTWRADPAAATLADRHYSRQTPGAAQFTPPGRVLVLITEQQDALWATSWPYADFVNREYPDAWVCTIFRNESPYLSSSLIRQAVAATCAVFGPAPSDGMVTMVDAGKVRHKRDPGFCFICAGFEMAGRTKEKGLIILQLPPEHMPPPMIPIGYQLPLLMEAQSGTPA